MGNMNGVWDFDFLWSTFGWLLKMVAPFVIILVAIIAVGLLLKVVIEAVRASRH